MIDEIFFKRAKEAIVEHFNSHCKVGDLFEDSVKTTEDFVCPVWFSTRTSAGGESRAVFQVTSSYKFSVFYSVIASMEKKRLFIDVLKVIDYTGKDLDDKDVYAYENVSVSCKPGQKPCDGYAVLSKPKGKDV